MTSFVEIIYVYMHVCICGHGDMGICICVYAFMYLCVYLIILWPCTLKSDILYFIRNFNIMEMFGELKVKTI